jgi:Sortase (surface protein transpeptidase)
MKNIQLGTKGLIFLLLGVALLLGGAVGIVGIFQQLNQESTPAVIPTQIDVRPTPVASDFSQPTANTPALQSTQATPEPVFPSLNASNYFVHPSPTSGLETPLIPDRIVIPSVGIDANVVISDFNSTNVDGETFGQWLAPNQFAAGWQPDSALLGQTGNTVIDGHHNEYGEVFGNLVNVKVGDKVYVYADGKKFSFIIANRMILQERFVSIETRLQNARWLAPTNDMRLTLVTCWPKISNTHRLILVARPDDSTT